MYYLPQKSVPLMMCRGRAPPLGFDRGARFGRLWMEWEFGGEAAGEVDIFD